MGNIQSPSSSSSLLFKARQENVAGIFLWGWRYNPHRTQEDNSCLGKTRGSIQITARKRAVCGQAYKVCHWHWFWKACRDRRGSQKPLSTPKAQALCASLLINIIINYCY